MDRIRPVAVLFSLLLAQSAIAQDCGLWEPVGSGSEGSGTSIAVNAAVAYNGELIVGGSFTNMGGVSASRVARWDGSSWSTLGSTVLQTVHALVEYNGTLIIAGEAGAIVSTSAVGQWTAGNPIVPLGSSFNGSVRALTVYSGDLIAGGLFTEINGQPFNCVARWNGTSWQPMGTGMSHPTVSAHVFALAVHNGELYAGGRFQEADGNFVSNIARWDGATWQPIVWNGNVGIGSPPGWVQDVRALLSHQGNLIVAGGYLEAGGQPFHRIARWDGSEWHPFGPACPGAWQDGCGFSGPISSLLDFDGTLVAGGSTNYAAVDTPDGPSVQTVQRIAYWDGGSWQPLGSGMSHMSSSTAAEVRALAEYNGDLYAGGTFTHAGSGLVNRIARWPSCIPGPGSVAYWINSAGGDFDHAANWHDDFVPGQAGTAVFDLPRQSLTIDVGAETFNARLLVRNGQITLNSGVHTYHATNPQVSFSFNDYVTRSVTIGNRDGDNASLLLENAMVKGWAADVASKEGSSGLLHISQNGTVDLGYGIRVSGLGDGTLVVSDGGTLHTSNLSEVAGLATISGTGSLWDSQSTVVVSSAVSSPLLIVEDGAHLDTVTTFIVQGTNHVGEAILRGQGSEWHSSSQVAVGINGSGTLRIEDGGYMSAPQASFGMASSNIHFGSGTLLLTGNGSTLDLTGVLYIGGQISLGSGAAFITVEDGAEAISSELRIGPSSSLADEFEAIVNVASGGRFTTGNVIVSARPDTVAEITVEGDESRIDSSGNIWLGGSASAAQGLATLTLRDGGVVSAAGETGITIWETGTVSGDGGMMVGDVTNRGLVSPGESIGVLTIDGNYTQSEQGTLRLEIAGPEEDQRDQLWVLGDAILDGVLEVKVLDNYIPEEGEVFTVLFADSVTGVPQYTPAMASCGIQLDMVVTATSIELHAVQAECCGDLTGDGQVNVFDLLDLLAAWGPCDEGEPCPADLTVDGVVNVFDLLLLLANWGSCPER